MDTEEANRDLLEGGDKLFNMVEEMVGPSGQFAGSVSKTTIKPQVRGGS